MKSINQKQDNFHRRQLAALTRKIKKSSPSATLNLISESAEVIQDSNIKEWLLRFKVTFEALKQGVAK